MATLLTTYLSWIDRTPDPRVVYAACHRGRSDTPPTPFVGLMFQASGEFESFVQGGVAKRIPLGHVALCNSHKGMYTTSAQGDIALWVVTLDVGTAPEFDGIAAQPVLYSVPVVRREALIERYATVAERYLQTGFSARIRLKAAILDLMAFALDEVTGAGRPADFHPALGAAEQFLREHMAESRLSIHEVARAAHASVRHVDRLFRRVHGMSPMRYLRELRMQHARRLLESSNLRVSEIATASGYSDALHFSRIFRMACGQSPRAYRNAVTRIL